MTQVREDQALRLPSDPNPYRPTQAFRRMDQIQQRRHAAQLFTVLTRLGTSAGSITPVGDAIGFDEGGRRLWVLLEVSLKFLTGVVE